MISWFVVKQVVARICVSVAIAFLASCDGDQLHTDLGEASEFGPNKNEASRTSDLPPKAQYPVDPDYREAVLEINEAKTGHCKELPAWKLTGCWAEVRDRYEPQGRLRGTRAYIDRAYSSLSITQLLQKRDELTLVLPKTRSLNPPADEDTAGELTRLALEIEIKAINGLLSDKKKAVLMEECVEAFGQKNAKKMCDHLE